MSTHDNDKEIKGHDYDGITEYDNPLPIWWLATFIGTVIFAGIYYLHYEVADGPSLKQELALSLKQIETMKANAPVEHLSEDQLAATFKDAKNIEAGGQIFSSKCAVCHVQDLQGVIGPNLVDDFWIHTKGTKSGIVQVITEGVTEKGMPAWKDLLKPDDILHVASFIYSKKGTHPANPKAPQGDKIEMQ